ncbi:AAA family ATPase [Bacteroidota bacterium]
MDNRLQENNNKLIRVAITGPESTGKTMLTEALAQHYDTVWVPEYARIYVANLNRKYTLDDIISIAKGQIISEKKHESRAYKFLFCDTELIVTKIWAEHSFKKCPDWILENINKQKYDLYLLCDIDTPWVPDPQREHPKLRQYFFDLFYNELITRELNYKIVRGIKKERIQNAIDLINSEFNLLLRKK